LLGAEAAQKVQFVPIPVNFHFTYLPQTEKLNEVIAVGRWDSQQKRTPLLLSTIAATFNYRDDVTFRIFGSSTQTMHSWHQSLPQQWQRKIILEGRVSNTDLAEAYQRARVMLVSSAYEGCHNASAEAVCSGASVVACQSSDLDAIAWHASRYSGSLSPDASAHGLSQALLKELKHWDQGQREPSAISNAWTCDMHPDRVARKILNLFKNLTI